MQPSLDGPGARDASSDGVPTPPAPHGYTTRARRPSRARAVALGACLAVAVVGAALGAIELRLRLSQIPDPADTRPEPSGRRFPLMLVDEPTCYFGYAPRTEQRFQKDGGPLRHRHVTDGDGFRIEAGAAPRSAACRILAVGDSYTAGMYVEAQEAWPAVLEAVLRARGYSVRVDNGGLQGHTITQERAEVLSRWAPLRPNIIVVGRSSNDLIDVAQLLRSGCRVGGPPPQEFEPALPERSLDLHLVAGAMEARARVHVMAERLRGLMAGGPPPGEAPAERAAAESAYLEEACDLTRGAAGFGARVLFANLESQGCRPPCDDGAFERRLTAAVSAAGASTVDLTAVLTGESMRLLPWDNHASPQGHAALAARLAAALVARGWLQGCR